MREKESGRIEGEDRGGRIEKREAEIFGGCEDYRGKGWLCLPVKALGGVVSDGEGVLEEYASKELG